MEDLLLRVTWRSLRRAVDPRVTVGIGLDRLSRRGVFRFRLLDRKWSRWGRGLGLGFDIFKVLQAHQLPAVSCARQQHADVLAELGAHAEVDERVVEAGRLGEETGDDAGRAWHVEAPG